MATTLTVQRRKRICSQADLPCASYLVSNSFYYAYAYQAMLEVRSSGD